MIGALIYISTLRNRSCIRKGELFESEPMVMRSVANRDISSQEGIGVSRIFSDTIDAEVYTADATKRAFCKALAAVALIVVSP